MTPPLDDDDLHSLLAQGGLSGAQRDRVFEEVIAAQTPARRRWRWAGLGGALLPIAALVALWISRREPPAERGDWLVAKGTGSGATIEARCPGRKPGECHAGDRLIFELDGAKAGGFFAGYAECEGKERIWYAPSADGELPALEPNPGHSVVPQAARIGTEHGVGLCTLRLFLLHERADRARLLSGEMKADSTVTLSLRIIP
jgi:hypothetical protein